MSAKESCKECGSTEHFAKEVTPGASGELLPVGALHGAKYRVVVCGACGLTRWFVPERFLALVRENFQPAE
jgi:predicted nucleic-acid-binding Zn-ribbon protein